MIQPAFTTAQTSCLVAENPSDMTLTGTNTYILHGTGSAIIVDPGDKTTEVEHLNNIRNFLGDTPVEMILVTHRHVDHTGAVDYFHDHLQVPVRAGDPAWCRNGLPLEHGEVIAIPGLQVHAVHTPGHTSDSFSFFLPHDDEGSAKGSLLTGDMILGEGTTMLDFPDGNLSDYFVALQRMVELPESASIQVLPAHGPKLESLAKVVEFYRARRHSRVEELLELVGAVDQIQTPVTSDSTQVEALTDQLYPQVPEMVRGPAQATVAATLQYLVDTTNNSKNY